MVFAQHMQLMSSSPLNVAARTGKTLAVCLPLLLGYSAAQAEQLTFGRTMFGEPGLIDMPAAHSAADGELSFSYGAFRNTVRSSLTFQLTPRLSAGFRYNQLYNIVPSTVASGGRVFDFVFDRSFSVHYRLLDEGPILPAVAVGLNDFLGTGFFESEYLVASKTLAPRLRATLGMGWGRLAGVGGFDNPLRTFSDSFDSRGDRTVSSTGGAIDSIEWFRGDAALFGGLQWQATDKILLTGEYSSDAYPYEDGVAFDRKSPVNLSLSYAVTPHMTVRGAWLYGSEAAVQLTYAVNPKTPAAGSGLEPAPPPVIPRSSAAAASWSLGNDAARDAALVSRVRMGLQQQDIALHGVTLDPETVRVDIENDTYPIQSQAFGRTARILTRTLPADVTTLQITLIKKGLPVRRVTLRRDDLAALEYDIDAADAAYARAVLDAPADRAPIVSDRYPQLTYGIAPYVTPSLFDPDSPVRIGAGLDLVTSFEPRPGLILSGQLRQPLLGNLGDATRRSDSKLPRVRSETNIYDKASPALTRLTAAAYVNPAPDTYGRVTAGYLEYAFGGISTEVLWAPSGRRYALGAELNHVRQRDFDQMFGFRDYAVTTGHLSAYYDLGKGYEAQVDLGRYLAGDWGGTLSLDRTFDNGWSVGAYATLTDVPFDTFGEGSFDKGIRLTVPVSFFSGRPSRGAANLVLQPILRDGGARLQVDGRLYDVVRDGDISTLRDTWGRFWR